MTVNQIFTKFSQGSKGVAGISARASMVATLVAFFALGFFSATLLSLFQFLAVVLSATLAVMIVASVQGMTLLDGLGLSIADLALAQVGYGLGLAWVASTRSRCARD